MAEGDNLIPEMYNKIRNAIDIATYKDPRFGIFFSVFKIGEDTAKPGLRTTATDCDKIYWDPQFVEGLSNEQLQGALYHELLHCLGFTGPKDNRLETFVNYGDDRYPYTKSLHKWQRQTVSNWASDYEINSALRRSFIKLPEGLLDSTEVDNLDLDEILDLVLKNTKYDKDAPCAHMMPPVL
jgi:hypothetical protein